MYIKRNGKHKVIYQKFLFKSNWFVKKSLEYCRHIYEEIFVRKYVNFFLSRWTKARKRRVVGTVRLFWVLGKLYVNFLFFYPIREEEKRKKNFQYKSKKTKKRKDRKKILATLGTVMKPIHKCRVQLRSIMFLYVLEFLLKRQIFYKFVNICVVGYKEWKKNLSTLLRVVSDSFKRFRLRFNKDVGIYRNTLVFLVHALKYKIPDAKLIANYIAPILSKIYKHLSFLSFLSKVLKEIWKYFRFKGIKILLAGKLNGFSRARTKHIQIGSVASKNSPLILGYGFAEAITRAGIIGVKIWIY
uniref:7bb486cc-2469-45ce-a2b7-687f3daf5ce3-CDS n=1 Tax=Plasmodiophora brassicae TaxID=37360 RepID=A0A3P3YWH1_PLABS|nr:7bb486cc-2469-45ce-a2b7-687f3daf5ce3-CDS [Plasmodiophora brassicae]